MGPWVWDIPPFWGCWLYTPFYVFNLARSLPSWLQNAGNCSPYTTRTQRDTTPRVRGLAADPNEAVQPTKRRRPQTGSPPQTVESPQPYRPWFVKHPSSTSWGIGPPPPFHRPDAGRDRAEITICKLSRAARIAVQHGYTHIHHLKGYT